MKFYYDSLFHFGDAYEWVIENIEKVRQGLKGRFAGEAHDYGLVAQCLYEAAKSNNMKANYLEIGTLFGGGLILMALVMKHFGIQGKCVAIDPLDGYYGKGNRDPVIPLVPSVEIVKENAQKFGVLDRIKVIPKLSYPFPEEARKYVYAVSFIDGDHWGDMPWKDFLSVKDITTHYIVFDNYDKSHPAVVEACIKASSVDDWIPVHVSSISFILQRKPKIVDRFRR